jgi:hypothetical protein
MGPGDPEYDARVDADIARLQAAKGIQVRAWFRENKTFVLVLLVYLAVIGLYSGFAVANGDNPVAGALVGIFIGPLVMLRIYVRFRR